MIGGASLCDELWLQDSGNRTWKFNGGHPGKTGLVLFLQEKRFERYVVLGNRRGPGTVEAVYDAAGEELICG